ncbi:MAG: flagellar basal body P-ring formation chaperone FlgA [Planctomycetota bacterium]
MSKSTSTRARAHLNAAMLVTSVAATLVFLCRASANNAPEGPQEESGLRIYLPREVSVRNGHLSLGQVSIIRGEDSLVARASGVVLGRISMPGQSLVIDRPTVLSRLACSGIPASGVILTGAEKVVVKQQHRVISGEKFVSLAGSFLESHRPGTSVSRWSPTRKPKDFVIPGADKDIRFRPRLSESSATNQARVEIDVFIAEKKIATRDVMFALKYNCRQAVTKTAIAAGQAISPENIEIQTKESNDPEPVDWKAPYGLVARRRLPANTILRPHMVGSSESPTVVKRNQTVVIRIERPGLLITAVGKTMENGKAGDYIRVRNADSQRVVLARINADGSVEPVL